VRLPKREQKPIALSGSSRRFIGRLNSRRFTRERTLLTAAREGDPLTSDEALVVLGQGETIAQALLAQGYVAQKLENQLSWGVSHTDEEWWLLLTFIPRPVAQWRLLPAVQNEKQTQLYSIIEQTIEGR
jgi:hypothetical protein